MQGLSKLLFVTGLLTAAASALIVGQNGGFGGSFLHATLPWLVGGQGVACGALSLRDEAPHHLPIAATALVVALSAILVQSFNPQWLNDGVYFVRVFFAHILLAASLRMAIKAVFS